MRSICRFIIVAVALSFSTAAFAQESEFQEKIQKDLDYYKSRIESSCGVSKEALTMHYKGKLGSDPRASEKPEWNSVSTLCTSAVEGLNNACHSNTPVKERMSKLTDISCTKGKGTIGYRLKGTSLTFTVDPSFTDNNPAGQRDDLTLKMKKDLDK